MTTKKTAASYSPEVRERAVRVVLEGGGDRPTQWAAIGSVSARIGCTAETLRRWVRQAERDGGQRPRSGPGRRAPSATGSRRWNAEPGAAPGQGTAPGQRDPAQGVGVFCHGGARPPVAPSTRYAHTARRADPRKLPARARSGAALMAEIRRVLEADFGVYGVRKAWRQLAREGPQRAREGPEVARCTAARLMRGMGLQGAVRGRKVRTAIPDPTAACLPDHVNRQFRAPRPNALWA